MLVLGRRAGEEIVINDNIRIRVLSIHGRTVRLGFSAPSQVRIYRGELRQRILEFELDEIAEADRAALVTG